MPSRQNPRQSCSNHAYSTTGASAFPTQPTVIARTPPTPPSPPHLGASFVTITIAATAETPVAQRVAVVQDVTAGASTIAVSAL